MIVKDEKILRVQSVETTIQQCIELDIFNKLQKELECSPVKGYGLVGAQIGYHIQAGIIRMPNFKLNYFNPKISDLEDKIQFRGEGCLSFPGKYINTERFNSCSLICKNEKGIEQKMSFEGMEAVVLQHEVDHLKGILFMDRQLKPFENTKNKIGRNDPCPCGSGKKYKKCCGF